MRTERRIRTDLICWRFERTYSHRTLVGGIGHNPQETPEVFADAVLTVGG